MAKTTYKVKKGDSFANLGYNPQEVMKLNPGVPKLSAGQTIFLPSKNNIRDITTGSGTNTGVFNAQTAGNKDTVTLPTGKQVRLAPYSHVTYTPPQTFADKIRTGFNTFVGNLTGHGAPTPPSGIAGVRGAPAYNPFIGINTGAGTAFVPSRYNPIQNQAQAPVVPGTNQNMRDRYNPTGIQYSGQSGMMGYSTPETMARAQGYNMMNYTGNPGSMQMGTAGMYNYNVQGSVNMTGGVLTGDANGGGIITPPSQQDKIEITPQTIATGRAQFLSGNGLKADSGYIPTRADVWNMKANMRRKKMAKGDMGDQGGGNQVVVDPLQNNGNAVNTSVSWRV